MLVPGLAANLSVALQPALEKADTTLLTQVDQRFSALLEYLLDPPADAQPEDFDSVLWETFKAAHGMRNIAVGTRSAHNRQHLFRPFLKESSMRLLTCANSNVKLLTACTRASASQGNEI